MLPCPVPHRTRVYADGEMAEFDEEGKKRRRRRRMVTEDGKKEDERECPVPKPSGLIGQILGFREQEGGKIPAVRVEKFSSRVEKAQDE